MRALPVVFCMLGSVVVCACGGGSAPAITAVTAPEPAVVMVGRATQLRVLVAVTDDDGDLEELRVRLQPPSGDAIESVIEVAEQAGTARNSTITALLSVVPTTAGAHEIRITAADMEGNLSASSTVAFAAEE